MAQKSSIPRAAIRFNVLVQTLAFVLLGERWTAVQVTGSVAILLGVAVLRLFGDETRA